MKNQKIMKHNIIRNILIFCIVSGMLNVSLIQAQKGDKPTNTISSRVVDESGQPIPNVFVRSFIPNDKVLTDSDGKFTLKVSSNQIDYITIEADGYEFSVTEIFGGAFEKESIVLKKIWLIDAKNEVMLPYQTTRNDRSVYSPTIISGDELATYPAVSFLESLSGRIPGLVINTVSTRPGQEEASAYIRGEPASIYIDGIKRDPSDLTVYEVETVQIIKDLSGRAALSISGAEPIIWITTKAGQSYKREIIVTAEAGISTPTTMPEYLDAYNYATLKNEALQNDGQVPLYTQEALDAYQTGSDPLVYPNINYYEKYVKSSSPFQRAAISFAGGDNLINYFSMVDYVGSRGLESIGELTKSDRFKIRGNVNLTLTDYIQMNINLSGTYGKSRFPNEGGGADFFNMFNSVLSRYPSNAHAMNYHDTLMISDDYPLNLENELISGGYAEGLNLNTQNTATLLINMNDLVQGLKFKATASFDVYNNLTNNKGGTAALYRLLDDRSIEMIIEEEVDPGLTQGYNDFVKRTVGFGVLNWDRVFGQHTVDMMLSYYQGYEERRSFGEEEYQPLKMQDLSYRADYTFNDKYILQLDLSYSGSMKLPAEKRFSLYPTVGAAWIISNESFLNNSDIVDYLKLYTSLGVMGFDNFSLTGYNTYYLNLTLWENVGSWSTGIPGRTATGFNVYNVKQIGSDNFTLPRRSYFNLGTQGLMFGRTLSFEVNWFYQNDHDLISQKASQTPSIFGGSINVPGTTGFIGTGFLPAVNYGEQMKWGFDGMIQYSGSLGNFRYSVGGNVQYVRGKYLVVDEQVGLEEYRKEAGKAMDLYWLYVSEGLYQSQDEINNRGVKQSWGTVQPGDIRYADYNDDQVVDEKDVHTTGAHNPRLYYGLNLSLGYRNFGLAVLGQGRANGEIMLSNTSYFWINGMTQNYSELMLDRWPQSNDFPRLTTLSENNYQSSDYWLASGGYFRLKNIEFSYTLPKTLSKNILMQNCKFFARGSNLAILSGLKKYSVDPENIWAGINDYPIFRTITFGVSCKF
jgi:TonB-linked SusC/RagA family outer membrane protein